MQNTYEFMVYSNCPVDHLPDVYFCSLVSKETIPVETILDLCQSYKTKEVYQEDIAINLARLTGGKVVLTGYHSGVKVTSEA